MKLCHDAPTEKKEELDRHNELWVCKCEVNDMNAE